MFQAYEDKYLGLYDNVPNYKLTIIDSDFQETVNDTTPNKYWVEHIIEIYSRRNLNVALNVFLYMQYRSKIDGYGYSIDWQISFYKKDIKDFEKYIPDIKKYLSLI